MSTMHTIIEMFLLALMVLSCSTVLSVSGQATPNPGCDYDEEVVPDRTYYVYSPNYPESYPKGIYCRWIARAPTRSQIVLTCNNFSIPQSQNCVDDRLSVSLTGDQADAQKYCGTGKFTLKSQSNRMLIEMIAPYYSSGGAFACSLVATSQPTPPPEVCDCGWKKEFRIVNGQQTAVNEFPMMAALVDQSVGLFCGATLISSRYCLTAAHCLVRKDPSSVGVLVGEHDIQDAHETNSAKIYLASEFIAYPYYNSATQVHDIALVKTKEDIAFSFQVGPACLPFRVPNAPVPGQAVQLLGWGTTEQSGPKSNVLLGTELDVINITYCQNTFGSSRVSNNQICTYRKGTDACQADSGGPVLKQGSDGRVRILGIISYGKGCAIQYPGVNTRVGAYLNWILEATPDASYCVR